MNSNVFPGAGAFHPTISIVTPSYNQGTFIEETILSVLSQKGDFFIDYIVMDGGSKDNAPDIIKKYENRLARHCDIIEKDNMKWYVKKDETCPLNQCLGIGYRWWSEKDNGQVDALKKGFREARGDIYCWLNSDDIYVDSHVLQRVCDYFQREPGLQLLTGDGPFISKTGEKTGLHHVERIDLEELIYLDYHILQPSTFFHEDIYRETHLDEHYTCAFDADFFIRMLCSGVNYKKVNDTFAAFRLYEETKTLGLSKTRIEEQIQITKTYSKNRYYKTVSTIYRRIQGIYEPRFKKKKPFLWFWIIARRTCYKLITGRWKRAMK